MVFDDVLDYLPENRLVYCKSMWRGRMATSCYCSPFDRFKPPIIHWEIKNMTRSQQEEALERVIAHGYRVCRSGEEDALAVLSTVQA